MAVPSLGVYFEGAYESDDGLLYRLGNFTGLYPDDQGIIPPESFGCFPAFALARHWLCQYSDGDNILLVKVFSAAPFSKIANPNRETVLTKEGITLDVLARVGETYAPYDGV